MSLMRARRERRELGAKVKRGMSPWKLLGLLIIVLGLIWWLGSRY